MQITVEEARRAGEISQQLGWTDEELKLVLSTTELMVSFLEGKGQGWSLAISPMRQEMEQLRNCVVARKQDKKE